MVLVGMQAADVSDDFCVGRQAERCASLCTGDERGADGGDVDPVVQGLDFVRWPIREAATDVVTNRIGDAQLGQASTKCTHEPASRGAQIATEGVVHADDREFCRHAGDVDRFETVGNDQRNIAAGDQPAQGTNGVKLETAHLSAGVVEKNDLV